MESIEAVHKYFQDNQNLPIKSKLNSVHVLSGGLCNYVYRVKFTDGYSAVLKYYPAYLANNKSTPVSQKRYFIEKSALEMLASQPWLNKNPNSLIRTPKLIHFDDAKFVLIMQDAGEKTQTLFDSLIQNSTLDLKFIESIPKEMKIFLHFLTEDLGLDSSTCEMFKNTFAWEILESYYTHLWSQMAKSLNMKKELEFYLLKSNEIFKRKNNPEAVFVFGDLWPSSILIDQETNLIWIIDWEISRYETKTRDLEQLLANLWIMKQSSKFDQNKINNLILNFQREFFGNEKSDWRKECGQFAKIEFILWVVALLNEEHWAIHNKADIVLKALQEIEE